MKMSEKEVPRSQPSPQQFALNQVTQRNKNRLQIIPGTILTEFAVNKLEIFKITSILKFIQADTKFLANLLKVLEVDVDKIKIQLTKENSPQLITAYDIYENIKDLYVLNTGITGLNELLDGGLQLNGYLLEICGISAVGKSLLCTTISINFALDFDLETIMIDTKRDATGTKILKISKARKIPLQTIVHDVMNKIKIERVFTLNQLIETLRYVSEYAKNTSKLKLLIIDSIPSLWYQFDDTNIQSREIFLSEISTILQKLVNECKLIIIVINIVTRWIEDTAYTGNTEISSINSTNNLNGKQLYANEIPALGHYWSTVPSTRIQMDYVIQNGDNLELTCRPDHLFSKNRLVNKRGLKIVKSNTFPTGKFSIIDISDKGF